jgi:hypothetical protein
MTSLPVVDSVTELVSQRLQASPYAAIRRVACFVDEGVLVLQGEVPSYYLKQLAQSAVIGFSSIARIANRIRVTDDGQE